MTKEELAAELYELIVNKCRFGGNPPSDSFLGNSYAELPDTFRNMWDKYAVNFAKQNYIGLRD